MTDFPGHQNITRPAGNDSNSWFTYTCGHCGAKVAGAVVSMWNSIRWVLCTACLEGSVITSTGDVFPGEVFGPLIDGLPKDVGEAYDEARSCMAVGAFIAAESVCRKILMHVAVEKGAKAGGDFAGYITHLEKEGFVTPPMKPWVDLIRKHGNTAQHKLDPPDKDRAEGTVMFTAELLRLIYEMDHMTQRYAPAPKQS